MANDQAQRQPPESAGGAQGRRPNLPRLANGKRGGCSLQRMVRLWAMKNIHSNPTPLRQEFIEYLTLNRKAERTVHCYVSFIYSLAKHYRRSPELLSHDEIAHW